MKRHVVIARAVLVLSVALAAGCASARHLREAQDDFSRGAAEENRLFAAGYPEGGVLPGQAAARGHYRLALAAVRAELRENTDELRRDRLYGTARMLEACCLWRLVALEGGDAARLERELNAVLGGLETLDAAGADGVDLGARDRVMIRVLPKLLDHERGLRATDWATAEANFSDAAEGLAAEAEALPAASPLRVYLRLAQLSTLRAWQSGGYVFLSRTRAREEAAKRQEEAKPVFAELEMAATGDEVLKAQIDALKRRLGMNVGP